MKTVIFIIGLLCVLVTPTARCQNLATFADGATVSFKKNTLVVIKDGKELFQQTVKSESTDVKIIIQKVSEKESAFLVTLLGVNTVRLLGIRQEKKVKLVWHQAVQFKGDLGEQSAEDVRLEDLDGDGYAEIVKGLLFEGTTLCGQGDSPLLFREVYDLKRNKFISIQLPRPATLTASLEAHREFVPVDLKRFRFLTASSVSSSMGDDHNPLLLTAPWTLVDSRPETGWSAGEGTGEGEFVTFKTVSAQWAMTAVGIEVATQEKRTKKGERFAIPASVVVSLENSSYRLRIPQTAGKHWFVFPTAQKSECLSLILEGGAKKGREPMALFDVSVQTEIHEKGGLSKLVGTLDDDIKGEQALQVLRSFGDDAYVIVKKNWKQFSPAGKRRAVRLLADIAPERGVHLLVSAAMIDSEFLLDDIVRGIKKSKGRGEAVLGKYLNNKSERKFLVAINLLQQLSSNAAFHEVLSGLTSATEDARQKQLGKTLKMMASKQPERMKQILEAAMVARQTKQLSLMFDLLTIAVNDSGVAEDAALIAREVYEGSQFENKYRALRIIGLSKVDFSIPFISAVTHEQNRHLRQLAARALGRFGKSQEALNGLIRLAEDHEAAVQIEALSGMLHFKQSQKQETVQRAFLNSWPQVRALAVLNAAHLPKMKKQMVKDGLKDKHYRVVLEAMKISESLKGKEIDSAITELMTTSNNAALLERAAQTAGVRCQKDGASLDALNGLLRVGAEPLANSTEKIIAVSAARALGEIGSSTAVKYLKKARERSNLTTDKAIDGALANASKGCAYAK